MSMKSWNRKLVKVRKKVGFIYLGMLLVSLLAGLLFANFIVDFLEIGETDDYGVEAIPLNLYYSESGNTVILDYRVRGFVQPDSYTRISIVSISFEVYKDEILIEQLNILETHYIGGEDNDTYIQYGSVVLDNLLGVGDYRVSSAVNYIKTVAIITSYHVDTSGRILSLEENIEETSSIKVITSTSEEEASISFIALPIGFFTIIILKKKKNGVD